MGEGLFRGDGMRHLGIGDRVSRRELSRTADDLLLRARLPRGADPRDIAFRLGLTASPRRGPTTFDGRTIRYDDSLLPAERSAVVSRIIAAHFLGPTSDHDADELAALLSRAGSGIFHRTA